MQEFSSRSHQKDLGKSLAKENREFGKDCWAMGFVKDNTELGKDLDRAPTGGVRTPAPFGGVVKIFT